MFIVWRCIYCSRSVKSAMFIVHPTAINITLLTERGSMVHPTAINITLLTERGGMVHPTAINITLLTERGNAKLV